MREVTMAWSRQKLGKTSFRYLDETVESMRVMGHLSVTPEGVRQIVVPTYREGKTAEDLDKVDFLTIEQRFEQFGNESLVVWNSHPLVCMASNTENIHVLPPYDYIDGSIQISVRGLPNSIATFVKMSKTFLEPDDIRVRNIVNEMEGMESVLTPRQLECFKLASDFGHYRNDKKITLQQLADHLKIARSTFQEHLDSAESTILQWASEQLSEK